jgi:lysyl endopeptidase
MKGALRLALAAALLCASACAAKGGWALAAVPADAVPVEVVKTDLAALIREAASSPEQFAVHIPHPLSVTSAGSWSIQQNRATWRYAVRIPTAVSMSFHASAIRLPPTASLTVRGARTTRVYTAADAKRGDLWSGIQPGDTLEFSLSVALEERPGVTLDIASLQAGYRGLGGGVADHPYYRRLQIKAAAGGNAACTQNYACAVSAANSPLGKATVGLVIGNLYQCTGTLLNDVPGDNTPYVLTARHCETGKLGGGNPGAASTTTVYWDAVSACGSPLGSLYDPGVATQTGAVTVVEQQDAWLLRLEVSPVVSDAQFAGFDATGGTIQGGYSIQHALGFDKQLTTWFGRAVKVQQASVQGTTYQSNFWEVVNQTGNIGPGTSGSSLLDQNGHVVGELSLGRETADASGYESCPAAAPAAPNGANGTADFTSLAAVWNSTADATSSTAHATLKSVLDPANSGKRVIANVPAASIAFSASSYSLSVGDALELTWSAADALQCTAEGGGPADGWSGALAAAGTLGLSETTVGTVAYQLVCKLTAGRSVISSVTVAWAQAAPQLKVSGPGNVWTTRPALLTWTSNVAPCAISGGALALAGLASSGSASTTQASTGDISYLISCGAPGNVVSAPLTVSYVTPNLVFLPNGTNRLIGQPFFLEWLSDADTCTPSGGAPNDGWTATEYFGSSTTPQAAPTVTTPGSYTYTLTCSSGPISVQQSVLVTFENDAPVVTVNIDTNDTVFSASPADYITFGWSSNLADCVPTSTPAIGSDVYVPAIAHSPYFPEDSQTLAPLASGTYVLSVTCTGAAGSSLIATSAPVTVTVEPPAAPTATLAVNPNSVLTGQAFTVAWSSTDTLDCEETGSATGSAWGTSGQAATSGTLTTSATAAGQFTLGVECPSIDPNQAGSAAAGSLTVALPPPPTVTLTINAPTLTVGQSLTLTWTSTHAAECRASGGGANGLPWSGPLKVSADVTEVTSAAGRFVYIITCNGNGQAGQAQAVVTVSAAPSGGGALGGSELAQLAALAAWAAMRRRAALAASPAPRGFS